MIILLFAGIVNNSTSTKKSFRDSEELIPPAKMNLNKIQHASYVKNIYSPQIYEELIRDVDGAYYSLIVNGLINLDNEKSLVLFIRYRSKKQNKIVTAFYRLYDMLHLRHLISIMKNDGLKSKYFLGFGIDSESIGIDEIQTISKYLRTEIPNIVINKYIYNTLLNIIVNSGKRFPVHLMWIVKETYKWFSDENRMIIYKDVYELILMENLQNFIESPNEHWLYYVKGIKLISDNWAELLDHFKKIKDEENDPLGTLLCEQYEKSINKLFLEFIHKSLNSLIELENELQTNTEYYPCELFERLNSLCSHFQSSLENLNVNFDNSIHPEEKEKFVSKCREFLKNFKIKLENLASEDSCVLGKISCFLQNNTTTIEDVIALIERFPHIGNGDMIANQWFSVEKLGTKYGPSMETIENKWIEIANRRNNFETYTSISEFALTLLSLPISSNDIKYVYSIINKINNEMNIKKTTEKRNIFSVTMLEALLRYYYVPASIYGLIPIERTPSTAENSHIELLTEEDIATFKLVNPICMNSNK